MSTQDQERLEAKTLHDILRGYVKTALLRTAIQLRVFDEFADGPQQAAHVAERVGADVRGTRILLDALAAIGLLRTEGASYRLPAGGEELLVSTGSQFFGGAVRIGASDWEWDAQKNLVDAVRKGTTVAETHALTPQFDYWEDFANHTTWFNNGAADVMADQLAPWAAQRESVEVLDVACSHGSYSFFFAQREPRAKLTCLDWPNVLEITERNAERLGLRDRVELLPGDMFEADLGGPYDVVMLTNVLHHFSEETATKLLTRVGKAVKPGGRIAVVGHTHEEDDTPETNPLPYLFSVIMLVQTFDGQTHSVDTYRSMLETAGFTNVTSHTGPKAMHRVFIAERP